MEKTITKEKLVYTFGDKKAEGSAKMKNLLGGKGANLAEMNLLGVPVPPGFVITTEVCEKYFQLGHDKTIEILKKEVQEGIKHVEQIMKTKFNDHDNPCLISVRSGARVSMPGMMDTVLNLGLNDETVAGIAKKTNDERFAWDSYRRLIQMYGDVVMELKPILKDDIDPFEELIQKTKEDKGIENDTDLTAEDLKEMVAKFKKLIIDKTSKEFPTDPWEQLWGAISAVFDSWNTDRAIYYRKINDIPKEWGTAVVVQGMVFGNMGDSSATGVAFTRDAGNGKNYFNGEFLVNAQGEDVVAGTRTPLQITKRGSTEWAEFANISENERLENFKSLEELMPAIYKELYDTQKKLEKNYADMQDLEFTIQEGKLWLLQTRNGKRTGSAMVKIGMDLLQDKSIDDKTAILRMEPNKLDELLHPIFDTAALKEATVLSKGLPASPGAACGQIVFFADDAENWAKDEKAVILVRKETSPEDLAGMDAAKGILTSHGGMTSHAAVIARAMGKTCISGAGSLEISYKKRAITMGDKVYKEGDWVSLNGTTGIIYEGKVETILPDLSDDFVQLMKISNKYENMGVRANADTPEEAQIARDFGAKGIGLCRTEHMFFLESRILAMREMILAEDEKGRRKALKKLLPMQRGDFEGIFEAMQDLPVTVRLLDPPLHEFLPHGRFNIEKLAKDIGISSQDVNQKINSLHETNPMLGHRGCRLSITYPEITEMQTIAIIEAALNLKAKGINVHPEIMIPLTSSQQEMKHQWGIVKETADKIFEERKDKIKYLVGTMIEIPRAALTADKIAEYSDFFSFGTNDLTQMTFGYSRDDAGKFLKVYLEQGILRRDPFEKLDQRGVGQLVEMGTLKGRSVKPNLKVGICGEHGGEPRSIEFFNRIGLDYVSCSPYRVPIARLACAQAAIRESIKMS